MALANPPHFDQSEAGAIWRVPYAERAVEAEEWASKHRIAPANKDSFRLGLLLVDCQNTFCTPGFELFVAGRSGTGAVDDSARISEFIYRNLGAITEIVATLDTHQVHQIFHPAFWIDAEGLHPEGGTIITPEDVASGRWRPDPAVSVRISYARHYVEALASTGKYPLMVWPYHAMVGGIGHALVSSVEEAIFFHSVARRCRARFEIKGANPLTEHYSALNPEVMEDERGEAIAQRNSALVDHLLAFDALVVAGQAKSHCVAWTVRDLLAEVEKRDRQLVERIYLLEDCSSAVVVPGVVDFTEQAEQAYAEFAAAGVHVVQSIEDVASWPGRIGERLVTGDL